MAFTNLDRFLTSQSQGDAANLANLEALQQQTGAPSIRQDSPGLFTRVLDIISRPNFAVAGIAEELASGEAFTDAMSRAGREVFSGLFGIEGEKRAFGEVLEHLGVGPGVTSSQVLPFLYTTTGEGLALQEGGPLDVSARGVGGLAADIFLDPLTYITAGTLKAGQVGSKFLSKAGLVKRMVEAKKALPTLANGSVDLARAPAKVRKAARELLELPDEGGVLVRNMLNIDPTSSQWEDAIRAAQDVADDRVLALINDGATELVDHGGVKFMGHSIPGTPWLGVKTSGLPGWLATQIRKTETGDATMNIVGNFRRAVVDPLGRIFNVAWDAQKAGAVEFLRSRQNFLSKMGADTSRWNEILTLTPLRDLDALKTAKVAAKGLREVSKKKKGELAELVNIYERSGVPGVAARYGEESLEARSMSFYKTKMDEIRAQEVRLGFDVPERENYFVHYYHNAPEEFERMRGLMPGKKPPRLAGEIDRHMEERAFDTFKEAVEWSKRNAKPGNQVNILRPLLSPLESLRRRGQKSIEAISWRGWTGSLSAKWGKAALGGDPRRLFELNVARNIPPKEAELVDNLLTGRGKVPIVQASIKGKTTSVATGNIPTEGLVVANIGFDGKLYIGSSNDLHFTLSERFSTVAPRSNGRLWKEQGFIGPDGKFLSREAAARKIIRGKSSVPGSVDMLDIRENRVVIKVAKVATPTEASVDNVATLRKLTPEGKRAFMEARIAAASSREELIKVLNKYDEFQDFWPKRRSFDGEINPLFVKPDRVTIAGVGDIELPDYIAKEIDQLTRPLFQAPELRNLLRMYDSLNNAWKSAVTVFWPAFHVRNLYSNTSQVLVDIGLGALDPKAHAEAVRILSRASGNVDIGGINYVRNNIHDTFKDAGIIIPANAFLEYTGDAAGKFTKIGLAASKLSPAKYARQFGGLIENEARVQFAIQWMRRGLTLEEAAKRTNKFLFDYSNGLTRVEREFFKRVIPFYTWQSKNFRLMFDNLRKRPGLLAAELKPFRGRHSEDEQMTSWNAENLKLRLDGDGRTVRMLQGVDLPVTNLDIIWSGNVRGTAQQLAGMVAPFIKAPFEAATGFNLFLGRPLTRKESAGVGRLIELLPDVMKDRFGYRKEIDAAGKARYTFDGNIFYLVFQSWMMRRLVSTSDRIFRNYVDKGSPQWQAALLDFGAGLRVREINFDEEQERRARERTRQLNESLTRRGVLATFSKTFKPKYEDSEVSLR